jgi:hypothetical protein
MCDAAAPVFSKKTPGISFSYKKRAAAKEFPEKLGRRAGFRREERLRKVLLQIF